MPFKIVPIDGKFQVVGPYKRKKKHVYGTHDTKEQAKEQQKALYVHTNESENMNKTDGISIIVDNKENTIDVIPSPPPGVEKAKPGSAEKYPDQFRPSIFKMPMNDKRIHDRHIMDFEQFLKVINYKTHDDTLQRGHGQNLAGK